MAGNNKPIEPLYTHWKPLTPEDYTVLMLDFKKYCAEGCIVLNKQGQAVPFILNEAQLEIARLILPLVFKDIPEPVSVVIHKARQEGVSVLLAALEKYISSRRKNLSTVHLLPTDDLAMKFYEQKARPLLEGTHPQLLPKVTAVTRPTPYMRYHEFGGVILNSFVKIGGAQSKAAGRSGTNHVVIFDEYAFYQNVDNLERGVLATQPKTGLVLTVYVSTANGVNHFYDAVKTARKPGSRMHYLFLPWHILKEYEMEPQGRLKDLTSLTDYELKLLKIFEERGYPISSWARKLQFYEHTLEVEAKNDQDYMFENYPSTPEESFEASGKPVLPANILMDWLERMPKFKFIEPFIRPDGKVEFDVVDRSTIKQYKAPERGRRYILAVDPSNGEEEGDSSSGVVVDEKTLEEVCTFNEKLDQSELAELSVNIAKYYNNAIIVPERNMGNAMITWIRLHLGYFNLWVDPNSTSKRPQYGVHMTRPVKNEAIQRMRFFMNNGIWYSPDKGFIEDGLHFSWKATPGGFQKAVAQGVDENNQPYHDDTVMARLVLVSMLDMRRWKEYSDMLRKQEKKHG